MSRLLALHNAYLSYDKAWVEAQAMQAPQLLSEVARDPGLDQEEILLFIHGSVQSVTFAVFPTPWGLEITLVSWP